MDKGTCRTPLVGEFESHSIHYVILEGYAPFFYSFYFFLAAQVSSAAGYYCNRGNWRESYKDDLSLGFKALTGSSDWVIITTTTTTTTKLSY